MRDSEVVASILIGKLIASPASGTLAAGRARQPGWFRAGISDSAT